MSQVSKPLDIFCIRRARSNHDSRVSYVFSQHGHTWKLSVRVGLFNKEIVCVKGYACDENGEELVIGLIEKSILKLRSLKTKDLIKSIRTLHSDLKLIELSSRDYSVYKIQTKVEGNFDYTR